tara:strand:+ start:13 stop:354 length:342 start_codon:yes stop_codon:yes gene_type:complete
MPPKQEQKTNGPPKQTQQPKQQPKQQQSNQQQSNQQQSNQQQQQGNPDEGKIVQIPLVTLKKFRSVFEVASNRANWRTDELLPVGLIVRDIDMLINHFSNPPPNQEKKEEKKQ